MSRRTAMLAWCLSAPLFLYAPDLRAQPGGKFVVAHLGGGYAEQYDALADRFDSGWGLYGGATLLPEPMGPFGLRLEMGASYFDATDQVIESETFPRSLHVEEGYRLVTSLSIAIQLELGSGSRLGGYVLGGLGGYSQYLTATGTVLIGDINCDPISQICVISGAGTTLHETDRLTKLGYNFGAGMTVAVRSTHQVYFEAQYRRMRYNEGTEFVPFVVGYRW